MTLEKDRRFEGNVLLLNGVLDLGGKTLAVNGNLIHGGGTLNINGGRLIVGGDYRLQTPPKDGGGAWGASAGVLDMTNTEDSVLVHGSFVTQAAGDHRTRLKAGVLEVRGDFRQLAGSPYSFGAGGSHRVVLAGDHPQHVFFASPSHSGFAALTAGGGIVVHSALRGWAMDGDLTLTLAGDATPAPRLPIPETASRSRGFTHTLRLNGHALHYRGDLHLDQACTIDIGGGQLKVDGDLVQANGTLNLSGGRLIVGGDYRLQAPPREDGGAWGASAGVLDMTNTEDSVLVHGSFVTQAAGDHRTRLKAGVLEVRGDFRQLAGSPYSFGAGGSHRVVLAGDHPQHVFFASPSHSGFAALTAGGGIVVHSALRGWAMDGDLTLTLAGDATPEPRLPIPETASRSRGFTHTLRLNGHALHYRGDLHLDQACTIDIGGGQLKVDGDLVQANGTLNLSGGRLIVGGDYRLQAPPREDGGAWGASAGVLDMTNTEDSVLVHGSFVTQAAGDHRTRLKAGVLEVRGDFRQLAGSPYNFGAGGSHRVVLAGDRPQHVSFASPSHSRFENLHVANPRMDLDKIAETVPVRQPVVVVSTGVIPADADGAEPPKPTTASMMPDGHDAGTALAGKTAAADASASGPAKNSQPSSWGKGVKLPNDSHDLAEQRDIGEEYEESTPSIAYSPPRFTMPNIPFTPALDINELSKAQYAGAVSMAMEGMRLIYGEMDEAGEKRFEAEWLPLFGQPTGVVVEYLNALNPLIVSYQALREAIHEAIDTYNAMALDFMVATSFEDIERLAEIIETFQLFWPFYERLQGQLETVVEEVLALGNPPRVDLDENRRRHRRHLDSFLGSGLVFGPCDSAAMAEDGSMDDFTGFLTGKGEKMAATRIGLDGKEHSRTIRFGDTGLADGVSGRSGGARMSLQVVPDVAATFQDAWEILRRHPLAQKQAGDPEKPEPLDIQLQLAKFGNGHWEGFLVSAADEGSLLSGLAGFVVDLETPSGDALVVLWRLQGLGLLPSTYTPPNELIFGKHPGEHARLDVERTRRLAAAGKGSAAKTEDQGTGGGRMVFDPEDESEFDMPPSPEIDAWYQAEKAALTARQKEEIEYFRRRHERDVAKTNRDLHAAYLVEVWKVLKTIGVERDGRPPMAVFDGTDMLALAEVTAADSEYDDEEPEVPESLANLAAAPAPDLPTEPEMTEEEIAAQKRQIDFHQANIEHFRNNIDWLRKQIAVTTDRTALEKLRDNLMVNEANLQEQRDRIASIRTGQFVRTRTDWDAHNLWTMIDASSETAQNAKDIEGVFTGVGRLIAMADLADQPRLRKFFDDHIASKRTGEYTVEEARRIAGIIGGQVTGELDKEAAGREDEALAAADLLERAEKVKFICDTTLMVVSTAAPYHYAHVMPHKFVQGLRKARTAYVYATYQATTGYIEGGVTEAFTRSATGYVGAYSKIGWVAGTFKTAMDGYHQAVLADIESGGGSGNEVLTGIVGAGTALGKDWVMDKVKDWALGAVYPAVPEFKAEWGDIVPGGAKGPPVVFDRGGRRIVPERRVKQPQWPTVREQLDAAAMKSRQANARATVNLFRLRAERHAAAWRDGESPEIKTRLREEMDQTYKLIKTDYFAKAYLNRIGRQGESKTLHYYNSRDRAYRTQLINLLDQRMSEAGISKQKYKSFSNSSSRCRAGMDLDLGVFEPPRYITGKDGVKLPNPEHIAWRRSITMRLPDGSEESLDPRELQVVGQLLLQDSFEELYGRPPGEAMVNFTTSYHPEAYRDINWLGGKGSRGALIHKTDPNWTQQAADVSNFKLHHLPQDHPGIGRYGLMQEQARGLVKDYDTKIEPMIKSGAHRNPKAAHHVRQIRDVMDNFAKDRIGPIEADRKIRELTGGYGIEEVGEQFSVIMRGLRSQL